MRLALGDGVAGFEPLEGGAIEVRTKSGKKYPADVVILALGVRPDTKLAKSAGLAIGERGGIRVDEHMRTSDPNIFAVGDAVEVRDFGTGRTEPRRTRRAGEPPGAHRRRRDRGTRVPLPRHAGHFHHRIVRRRGGMDGREREDAEAPGRRRLREDLSLSEFARRLLPGRQAACAQVPLSQVRWSRAGRAGARRGRSGRRQAHQRARRRNPDGRDHPRPRGGRAVLRAAVRKRQGCGELRGNGRRRRARPRHAARPLGQRQGRLPARRAPAARACRGKHTRCQEHSAARASFATERAAQGSRDSRDLPLRPARVLRNADPAAERIQGARPFRRHVVANPACARAA